MCDNWGGGVTDHDFNGDDSNSNDRDERSNGGLFCAHRGRISVRPVAGERSDQLFYRRPDAALEPGIERGRLSTARSLLDDLHPASGGGAEVVKIILSKEVLAALT